MLTNFLFWVENYLGRQIAIFFSSGGKSRQYYSSSTLSYWSDWLHKLQNAALRHRKHKTRKEKKRGANILKTHQKPNLIACIPKAEARALPALPGFPSPRGTKAAPALTLPWWGCGCPHLSPTPGRIGLCGAPAASICHSSPPGLQPAGTIWNGLRAALDCTRE